MDSSSSDSKALVSLGRQRVLQPLIANVTWLTKERKFDTIRVFACLNYWLDTKLFVRTHHKIPISTVQTCILDLELILFSPLYSLSLSLPPSLYSHLSGESSQLVISLHKVWNFIFS